MVEKGVVLSRRGARVPVAAGTMCLRGDQPGAIPFAKALRLAFAERVLAFAGP